MVTIVVAAVVGKTAEEGFRGVDDGGAAGSWGGGVDGGDGGGDFCGDGGDNVRNGGNEGGDIKHLRCVSVKF